MQSDVLEDDYDPDNNQYSLHLSPSDIGEYRRRCSWSRIFRIKVLNILIK